MTRVPVRQPAPHPRAAPRLVKLDRSLIAGLESDYARHAMIAGLAHFARATGFRLIAEGIETDQEFAVLRALDIHLGQGSCSVDLFGSKTPANRSCSLETATPVRRQQRQEFPASLACFGRRLVTCASARLRRATAPTNMVARLMPLHIVDEITRSPLAELPNPSRVTMPRIMPVRPIAISDPAASRWIPLTLIWSPMLRLASGEAGETKSTAGEMPATAVSAVDHEMRDYVYSSYGSLL